MTHEHHEHGDLYQQWVTLLSWLQEIAQEHGLEFEKVSDFADYIYRMERPYTLPTTVQSVALNYRKEPLLLAAVSARHVELGGVQLRLMGGSKHWHFHAGPAGLLEGKRLLTREHLVKIVTGALQGLQASA